MNGFYYGSKMSNLVEGLDNWGVFQDGLERPTLDWSRPNYPQGAYHLLEEWADRLEQENEDGSFDDEHPERSVVAQAGDALTAYFDAHRGEFEAMSEVADDQDDEGEPVA